MSSHTTWSPRWIAATASSGESDRHRSPESASARIRSGSIPSWVRSVVCKSVPESRIRAPIYDDTPCVSCEWQVMRMERGSEAAMRLMPTMTYPRRCFTRSPRPRREGRSPEVGPHPPGVIRLPPSHPIRARSSATPAALWPSEVGWTPRPPKGRRVVAIRPLDRIITGLSTYVRASTRFIKTS